MGGTRRVARALDLRKISRRAATALVLAGACASCSSLWGIDELSYDATGSGAVGGATASGAGGSTGGASTGGGGLGGTGGTTTTTSTGTAGAKPFVEADYGFRQPIHIGTGGSSPPAGYSLALSLDHAALVVAGHALASGNDMRIVRKLGGALIELDRVLDPACLWDATPTVLWFRTVDAIAANGADDTYYLYFGNPGAVDPPADPAAVYEVWDPFDGQSLDPAWTFSTIGQASGSVEMLGGTVRLHGSTGTIYYSADDFVFLHRDLAGDFRAETRIIARGGTPVQHAVLGGVMVRASLAPGSRHRTIGPVEASYARMSVYRLTDSTAADYVSNYGSHVLPEVEAVVRLGSVTRTQHSADDLTWVTLGTDQTFAQPVADPVLVGIPFSTDSGGDGWVDIDWFRARKVVDPEPTVTLGSVETGPF